MASPLSILFFYPHAEPRPDKVKSEQIASGTVAGRTAERQEHFCRQGVIERSLPERSLAMQKMHRAVDGKSRDLLTDMRHRGESSEKDSKKTKKQKKNPPETSDR